MTHTPPRFPKFLAFWDRADVLYALEIAWAALDEIAKHRTNPKCQCVIAYKAMRKIRGLGK